MKNALKRVVHTLNTVEVKGRENMDSLLGCIMTLDKILEVMDAADQKNEEVGNDDTENQQGE